VANEIERSIFFYQARATAPAEWKRDAVLDKLKSLQGDQRFLDVGNGEVVFVIVDQVPKAAGAFGRLRLLRSRRSNLPAMEDGGVLAALPIPNTAGIAEPCHVVFGPNGRIAAEYNHFAPRLSALARYISLKAELPVSFGTFVEKEILDRLERMEDVRLLELSFRPNPVLAERIKADDRISQAVYQATQMPGERRVSLAFSGDPKSQEFTATAKNFAKRLFGIVSGEAEGHQSATVFRAKGFDPLTGAVEVIDLLAQKVVRKVSIDREAPRSKALDTSDAYKVVEAAFSEAEKEDLAAAIPVYL
jgi:hypothetical protein